MTRWDTQAAYDDFMGHMKDTSRVYALRAVAELIGGAMCLLAVLAKLFLIRGIPLIGFGMFLLGFMILTADGFVSLMRSRRIAGFR